MPVGDSIEAPARIRWGSKAQLPGLVRRSVFNTDVVLDVGAGIEPQRLIWPKLHICVEIHDEYVEYLSKQLSGSPRHLVIHSDWRGALRIMPSKSVDTVVALDFIEHLTKDDGRAFIAESERVARRQVVLFTPLGFFAQAYDDPTVEDRWGMHGGYWQTHRSGWEPSDFSADWDIIACREYHTVNQHGRLADPAGCMWAIRTFVETKPGGGRAKCLRRRILINRYLPGWCRPALQCMKRLLPVTEK